MDASHAYQMVDVVPRALGVATANHEDPSRQFTTVIVPACSPIPEGGLIVTSSFGLCLCVCVCVCVGGLECVYEYYAS